MTRLTLAIAGLVLVLATPLLAGDDDLPWEKAGEAKVKVETSADVKKLADDTSAVYVFYRLASKDVLSALAERKLPKLRTLQICFSMMSMFDYDDPSLFDPLADFKGIESLGVTADWSPTENFYDHIANWTSLKSLTFTIY